MKYFDVFNGDADGICALHQLRLAEPRRSTLISGVKRDIKLLRRIVRERNATVTVLDVSLDQNREELKVLLETSTVLYIDHHYAGEIPESENLEAHIDSSPDVCTSLIVDRLLGGRFKPWAVAAAFGDNLNDAAARAAGAIPLPTGQVQSLKDLGVLMNYNGYGKTIDDLLISPLELFRGVSAYEDPMEFYSRSEILQDLREGYSCDMAKAASVDPVTIDGAGRIYEMPAEAWARRVAGVFSNEMARRRPDLAHALMVDNGDGTALVSVRAPLSRKSGADALCRKFPTGGGRAAAAGINALPDDMKESFMRAFWESFSI